MTTGTCLYVAGIEYDSSVDGPGLRTTIFTQGCDHHCVGCHNPSTHTFNIGTVYQSPYTDLIQDIKNNSISKKITFSGGDPLYQIVAVRELYRELVKHGYDDFVLYTGFTIGEILDNSMCSYDVERDALKELVLNMRYCICDPFKLKLKSHDLLYRGSSNQRIVRYTCINDVLDYIDVSTEIDDA